MTLADRVVVLNHGRIEQQGTPLELYKTPANLFVAAFIGSPAMNLIEGVVDGEGDQPAARLKDGTAIRIAASRNVKRGQSVTIGLRPEHIGSTVGGDISLSGRTVLVEPTGAQTHVVFELAGDQVTAVVDGEQLVKVNTPFAATVHHERVHVFDRASGLAL
jgi:multiple sugar transport system ATP-binding protein